MRKIPAVPVNLEKQRKFQNLAKRLYAGGILNIDEIAQIPAYKVDIFETENCTEYETVTQIQNFIIDRRTEIEEFFKSLQSAT